MRLSEWLGQANLRLRTAGVESPGLEAQLLAGHVLGKSRTWIVAHPEEELPDQASEHLLIRREGGEPLAYILGQREFYGRAFGVRRGVLIPRQETELLVENAPYFVSGPTPRVLDIGTGSGCIAVSLKLEHPDWEITAVDISPEALEVARENASRWGAEVRWRQSDLFMGLADEVFDLIVTNPPYVEASADLPREVRDWEPHSALFAPKETLGFYRRLAADSGPHLRAGGALLTEIGRGQGSEIRRIFEGFGWRFSRSWNDLAGIERVLAFSRP